MSIVVWVAVSGAEYEGQSVEAVFATEERAVKWLHAQRRKEIASWDFLSPAEKREWARDFKQPQRVDDNTHHLARGSEYWAVQRWKVLT